MAHTLQTERDSARIEINELQRDKIAAYEQILALQTDMEKANDRIINLVDDNQALRLSCVSLLHTAHARLTRTEYDTLKLHQ